VVSKEARQLLEDDIGDEEYEMTEEEEEEAEAVDRLIEEEQHNLPDAITEEELEELHQETQEYALGHCSDCSESY
jgi:hypothetical protein